MLLEVATNANVVEQVPSIATVQYNDVMSRLYNVLYGEREVCFKFNFKTIIF